MKLGLGTAQFGLNYGISNKRGKISPDEAFKILDLAYDNGINFIDTADSYGDSEDIIGNYIYNKIDYDIKIVSKFIVNRSENIITLFNKSLKRLNISKLYGYLFHSYKSYKDKPDNWKILQDLKAEKKIEKIGFSLYYPEELDDLIDNGIHFDILQLPYSVFDQRFNKYFNELKKLNTEVHVRSVFLQGLVFMNPNKLNNEFFKIKSKIELLKQISYDIHIPVSALCLNFAVLNPFIDKVIIGVESKDNLMENINYLKNINKIESVYKDLEIVREDDEMIILPFNWTKGN